MRLEQLIEKRITPELEKKFGRILFGDFQRQAGLTTKTEKDTKYEREVYDNLYHWIYGEQNIRKVQNNIIELSRLKDNYPTLLKPDSIKRFPKLYRGLYGDRVRSWGKHEGEYVGRVGKRRPAKLMKAKEMIYYKPKRICESWTTSKTSAYEFLKMNRPYFDPRRAIIIEAKVPIEERLFKLKFTNNIHDENEVVRVSNKPIDAVVYYLESYG